MKLIWLPEAKDDVDRLYIFLMDINPASAAKALQGILDGSQNLQEYPHSGKPMPDETGRREYFIPFGAGSYVLRYKLSEETIVIIRVWHSREAR